MMDLQFSEVAWAKIKYLVQVNQKEVGWFGVTQRLSEDAYQVVDIFVPEQEVTGTDWLAASDAMADMQLEEEIEELLDAGGMLNYMGHSHVSMGVSPSPQDEDYINTLLDGSEQGNILFTTIHNKMAVTSGQVSVIVPKLGRMSADLNITFLPPEKTAEEEWAEDITELMVADKKLAPRTNPYRYPVGHVAQNPQRSFHQTWDDYDDDWPKRV